MDGDVRDDVSDVTGDRGSALQDRIGPQLEQVRETLLAWNQRALGLIRENPGAALLCAVGLGFAIGRLASRR